LPPASATVDQFVGKDAAVMGWGKLESGKKFKHILNFIILADFSMSKENYNLLKQCSEDQAI
jgi:hypothetical protein